MSDQDLAINQLASENIPDRAQELAQLFPEVITDGKVDVEKLKILLGEKVEESQERYGLTWPGKRDAIRLAQKQSTATLEPMPDDSIDWDTTKNLIIEGDNLEVLKLLQKSFYGKVKMIYIDPPYNTTNDFVYDDDFVEPTDTYLKRSGQVDGNGFRTDINKDSSGRYHSDWLTMMYPRLVLARNLLSEDGAIFISIDANEHKNLSLLLDEVFGEENRVADFAITRAEGGGMAKQVVIGHDQLLAYGKNLASFEPLKRPKDVRGSVVDVDGITYWIEDDWLRKVFGKYGTCHYEEILEYRSQEFKSEVDAKLDSGEYRLIPKRNGLHAVGRLRQLDKDGTKFYSVLKYLSKSGKARVADLGLEEAFDFPKPVDLIRDFVLGATIFGPRESDIILDFFAGSGSTADAVMAQNAEDGGNRRFILVQLPEATDNTEFPKISDITRERVRRAGKKTKEEAGLTGDDLDIGFRAFKLSESNFKNWDADAATLLADDLEAFVNNINTNANDVGIVHEILLKAGIRPDTELSNTKIAGQGVTLAAEGLIAVSATRHITQEFINGLLALEPQVQQVYLLDSGFGDNDSLKVNARHQFAARRSDSDPDKDDALRTV